jgi:hypothetical protein
MAEMKTEWPYPLIETTLDKRLSRPGVQKGMAAELTGVDGSDEGGLRPFPGMRLAYTIDQLKNQTNHSVLSQVIDFHPVDFRIGSEYYGYGFVYRATRPGAPTVSDVFLDYWNSGTQAWTKCRMLMQAVDATAQFDVQVAGRFLYCFATGRSPSLFYVEATSEKEYEPEADNWIDSSAPTTVNNPTPGTPTANSTNIALKYSGGYYYNGLVRFDTSAEALETVESATLEFTVTENNNTANTTTLEVKAVTDPTTTGTLWSESQVTWNSRATAVSWSTAGGSFNDTSFPPESKTLAASYRGRVVFTSDTLKNLVQKCIGASGSRPQLFTAKTDFLLRAQSSGTGIMYLASRRQANPMIRPKLRVVYSSKTFFTEKLIGVTGLSDIPGPGLQPSLKSPEGSNVPGTLTTISGSNRPAAAQIVMSDTTPYSQALFPDSETGTCYNDTLPTAPAAPSQPGNVAYNPALPAGACTTTQTTFNAGLRVTLASPSYRQINVSVTPELDWSAFHIDGEALPSGASPIYYSVYMTKEGVNNINAAASRIVTNLTDTRYSPGQLFANSRLEYNTKYYWRVEGRRSDCNYTFTSPTSWFVTENRYNARKLEPGDYSFGYVLVDSKTGRKSAFSEVAQARGEDFRVMTSTTNVQRERYVGVEIVYDSGKYDLMYVYRSVKIQDAGGTMVAGLPFLDAIVELQDYWTCLNGTSRTFDPASTAMRHALYYYELEDKQLVYQAPYTDRSIFDQKMPFGGSALLYDSTMLVSRIDSQPDSSEDTLRVEDVNKGLGEMRWSSLQEFSPELFPPFNRHNPTLPTNEAITFAKVGSNALGFGKDRVFHIRKSGGFIRVQEMYEGYGIVNPKAVDVVSSVAYYVSPHGIKAVDSQAQLDEIRVLNSVITGEWKSDHSSLQVGYDATMNTLFILNPVQEEAYCMWFGSAKTTKLVDMNFDHVSPGAWPDNFTGSEYSNSLTRRAMFLMNEQGGTGLSGGGFAGPKVYVVDNRRTRVISGGASAWNGSTRRTMLDFNGDSRVICSGPFNPANDSIPISPTGTSATIAVSGAYQYCYLYLLYSTTNQQHIGKKVRVLANNTTTVFLDESGVGSWVSALTTGDILGMSPVYFEWVGHNLGLNNEVNQVFSLADFFRMKTVASVGCAFTDVAGPPLVYDLAGVTNKPLARFVGALYSGTDADAYTTAQTEDTARELYGSVQDGEGLVYAAFGSDGSDGKYGAKGNSLSPGVRIFCPDLDYRLLACSVRGTISSTERTTNIRGS